MMTDLSKSKKLSLKIITKFYPFKSGFIERNKGKLNWYALSLNTNVQWEQLSIGLLCEHLLNEADVDFVTQMQANCTPNNYNPSFECAEYPDAYFGEKLSWIYLDSKRVTDCPPEVVRTYLKYYQQYVQANKENYDPTFRAKHISPFFCSYFFTKESEIFFPQFQKMFVDNTIWNIEAVSKFEQYINWPLFSDFTGIVWITELLNKYHHKFDKDVVLKNTSFPLTDEMIATLQPSDMELLCADERLWKEYYSVFIDDAYITDLLSRSNSQEIKVV